MEKMDGKTMDIVAENVGKLKELFPEAFTEGKVDFEALKEVLGTIVDDRDERFSFTWNGKSKARMIAQTPSTGTLRPCKEESVDWDATQNIFIEGDNLEVLKLLQKSYHKKVKMIYIDPPYNTGKDFVYKDNFKDNIKNYKEITGQVDGEGRNLSNNPETSGRYHTDWLNMMYPRLKLARNLLKDEGVIFISIDDNEVSNLRKMCDEIFGEENHLGTIVWETATDNNPSQIAMEHEYVLVYSKAKEKQAIWQRRSGKAEIIQLQYEDLKREGLSTAEIQKKLRDWINSNKKSNELDLSGVSHYSYVDDKGVFYPGNSANTKPGGYMQDIIHPLTGEVCAKPENGYRWPENTFNEAHKRGDVLWGQDEQTIPKIKKRLETATELFKSYFYQDNRGTTRAVKDLFGGKKVFDNPKSLDLTSKMIDFSCGENDLVVDFFAGSSSSAHAVMQLNAENRGNRKFIMVQLPEICDEKSEAFKSGYKTIAEISKERIRRAGAKIKEELTAKHTKGAKKEEDLFAEGDKENFRDFSAFRGSNLPDLGFKVFKLDSTNIKPWEVDFDMTERTLEDYISNIKTDRREEDVLYEVLLKYGLDLTLPITEHAIAGQKVFDIGMGALIICLSDAISLEVVEGMAKLKEELNPEIMRVVFKDSGFKDDVVKTNAVQILKQAGIVDVRSL